MKTTRIHCKLLVACIASISLIVFLKANYYESDFFPIGLTGLNNTGHNTIPYGNAYVTPTWAWDRPSGVNTEQSLINSLGVNCIGGEDGDEIDLTNTFS